MSLALDNLEGTFNYMARSPDGSSVLQECKVAVSDYNEATRKGMSFKDLVNSRCQDADPAYGCGFDQAVVSLGYGNKVHGHSNHFRMSPTLAQVLASRPASPMMGSIVAPDGTDTSVSGRIFYPEIVMDIMRDTLMRDNSDIEQGFNNMVAVFDSIDGARYTQPVISVDANENVPAQRIVQGADPAVMVGITASDTSRTIATKSIGVSITDDALKYTTVDLLSIILAAKGRGERIRTVEGDISNMLNGSTDLGLSALSSVTAQSYDSAITTAGTMTHKAFVKILHEDYQRKSLDSVIMDLDSYLAIEGRAGRPTVDTNRGTDDRLDTNIRRINTSLQDINVLVVDTSVIGANTMMFLDSRFAMRKVTNVNANYEAMQEFVMRRIKQMRFDWGFITTRLYDEAFKVVTMTV